MVKCPTCQGYGVIDCMAWDIVNQRLVDVTTVTYFMLPDEEDEAVQRGKNYCKGDACRCPHCWGEGRIPEDY
jgi:hypothetical protein